LPDLYESLMVICRKAFLTIKSLYKGTVFVLPYEWLCAFGT